MLKFDIYNIQVDLFWNVHASNSKNMNFLQPLSSSVTQPNIQAIPTHQDKATSLSIRVVIWTLPSKLIQHFSQFSDFQSHFSFVKNPKFFWSSILFFFHPDIILS